MRHLFVLRALTLSVFACGVRGPKVYDFAAVEPKVPSPVRGGHVGEGIVVARDRVTQHQWATFAEQETCFLSQLDGVDGAEAQTGSFELMAFRDAHEPLDSAPKAKSSRVTLLSTGHRLQATTGGPVTKPQSVVQVCFADPRRLVSEQTKYVVLHVPWDASEPGLDFSAKAGTRGSRDGVWELTP